MTADGARAIRSMFANEFPAIIRQNANGAQSLIREMIQREIKAQG
jgi:hypothetical protein